MNQLMSENDNLASSKWVTRMQALSVVEQADMLAGAVRLLRHPDTISTPMESELQVLTEQVYLSLGRHLLAR